MRKLAIFLLIILGFSLNVKAHVSANMESQNSEQLLNNPEPNTIPEVSLLPMPNIVKNVFEDQAPAPIDPGGPLNDPFDPGADPNAPIDGKLWILLILVLIVGLYFKVKVSRE